MYWCISLNKNTYNHQEIILEVKSKEYNKNMIYRSFFIALYNKSFQEIKTNILKDNLSKKENIQ